VGLEDAAMDWEPEEQSGEHDDEESQPEHASR